MSARIREAMDQKEQGFTLIELLVVIVIIGILAAVAIPILLDQRQKAGDSALKSDLRSAANEFQAIYTEELEYPTTSTLTDVANLAPGFTKSAGTASIRAEGDATTYCIIASGNGSQAWVYKSDAGGLQPKGVTSC